MTERKRFLSQREGTAKEKKMKKILKVVGIILAIPAGLFVLVLPLGAWNGNHWTRTTQARRSRWYICQN
jgi:hypothetical protein